MTCAQKATFGWWLERIPRYNLGLLVAGVAAFILYILIGSFMLPASAEFEVTLFTLIRQVIAYLFMMVAANVCYLLGPIGELYWAPQNPASYRCFCFNAGFWGSCALPFLAPALLMLRSGPAFAD